jgi:hypothetical protein
MFPMGIAIGNPMNVQKGIMSSTIFCPGNFPNVVVILDEKHTFSTSSLGVVVVTKEFFYLQRE